jgi:hypothetical protein
LSFAKSPPALPGSPPFSGRPIGRPYDFSKEVDIGSNGVILIFKDLMRKGGIMAEERSLAELKDRVKKLGGYL